MMRLLIRQHCYQGSTRDSSAPGPEIKIRETCEIQDILKDFLLIQELIDSDISENDYYLFYDYIKNDQLIEWHGQQMNKIEALRINNLNTCEGIGCANELLSMYKERFAYMQRTLRTGVDYYTTNKLYPFDDLPDYSLEDIINDLQDISEETASNSQIRKVNGVLDRLEYFGGCQIRASKEHILEDAKNIASKIVEPSTTESNSLPVSHSSSLMRT